MTKTKQVQASESKKPIKLNASQRIEVLEKMNIQFQQQVGILADEIDNLRTLMQSLSKRLNASITATDSNDKVNEMVLSEAVKELEGKVEFLTNQGVLERNDSLTVTDKTFVVGRELSEDGTVVNPRVQFAIGSLPPSFKDELMGKKIGDVFKLKESDLNLEITEVHEILDPNVKQEFKDEEEEKQASSDKPTKKKKKKTPPAKAGNEAAQ